LAFIAIYTKNGASINAANTAFNTILKNKDAPVIIENAINTTIIIAEKIPIVAKSFTDNLFDIIIPPGRKILPSVYIIVLSESDKLYPIRQMVLFVPN
jgi:hypothetical protein